MEKLQVGGGDCAILHQRIEVDDLFPETGSVENDGNLLGKFLRLDEREDLEKLVHRPKPPRKNHQRLRQICEPELPHEEVVELEVELPCDVRIRELLERQT